MKKYLILLLVIAFATSLLFMGVTCDKAARAEEVVEEEIPTIKEEMSFEKEVRLTSSPDDGGFPYFSPDGKMIVFVSGRDGNGEIYIMNADGSGQINLTNNPADDFNASWSSDGKTIVFTSDRDGNYNIYIMNIDGSDQVNLTNDPSWDGNPSIFILGH